MRGLTPTWAIWCNGNTSKIRVEYRGGVTQEHKNRFLFHKTAFRPRSLISIPIKRAYATSY